MSRKRKGSNAKGSVHKPVLKVRHFLLGLMAVCLITLIPLLTVFKQVYIRNQSIRNSVLADSLVVRRTEVARLRFVAGTLSANDRIEQIARTRLGLEYPSIGRIIVMHPVEERKAGIFDGWRFLAIVKKSISQGRG